MTPPAGYSNAFPRFCATPRLNIRKALERFLPDSSLAQIRAWDDSIPRLQKEATELLDADARAKHFAAILEYQLPYEARRPDVVVLANGTVVVLEFKGKERLTQADLDQVSAYARDLRAYHQECAERPVHAVCVPVRSKDRPWQRDDTWIVGPEGLDGLIRDFAAATVTQPIDLESFLDDDAYRPLPSLVGAARELFHSGEVREIWRAKAATGPAVQRIAEIAHEAARTRTRHLILLRGVPGAGKTLVGMQAVHAHYLDDLSVTREKGKPSVPGLYLSGNGPLVKVLQYELKKAGGGGKTFVRHIKDYLNQYIPRPERIPNEHVLVFDEAQRAFTSERVKGIHKTWKPEFVRSEPELFVQICERMPEWSVLVGLIGDGQEIHVGEEAGLTQWRAALEGSAEPAAWTVHAPAQIEEVFAGSSLRTQWEPSLNLDTELRFHQATELHDFVAGLLAEQGPKRQEPIAGEELGTPAAADRVAEHPAKGLSDRLWDAGYKLWLTRDLETGKAYLQDRYAEDPNARFGLLASSRDKDLESLGIDNSFQASRVFREGPWFCEGEENPESCRRLERVGSEFHCQGLELEMALLCWGTDLIWEDGAWTNRLARGYRKSGAPDDALQLRLNAYRVLLTRGRDGVLVHVPELELLEGTVERLMGCGFRKL